MLHFSCSSFLANNQSAPHQTNRNHKHHKSNFFRHLFLKYFKHGRYGGKKSSIIITHHFWNQAKHWGSIMEVLKKVQWRYGMNQDLSVILNRSRSLKEVFGVIIYIGPRRKYTRLLFYSCLIAFCIMTVWVVEFSNGGYKIRKIFA